jgi:hypothetical protein
MTTLNPIIIKINNKLVWWLYLLDDNIRVSLNKMFNNTIDINFDQSNSIEQIMKQIINILEKLCKYREDYIIFDRKRFGYPWKEYPIDIEQQNAKQLVLELGQIIVFYLKQTELSYDDIIRFESITNMRYMPGKILVDTQPIRVWIGLTTMIPIDDTISRNLRGL